MKLTPTPDGTWVHPASNVAVSARTREEAKREIARRLAARKAG